MSYRRTIMCCIFAGGYPWLDNREGVYMSTLNQSTWTYERDVYAGGADLVG